MKKDDRIRNAIDESLGSVRFNAQDMRAVLRAARCQEPPAGKPVRRKRMRLDFALAVAMVVIVVAPLSVFALRARNTQTADIKTLAAAGTATDAPDAAGTPDAQAALSPAPDVAALSESDAIRIARACFEAECDTSVFTFEEYTVSVSCADGEYTVCMESVYDNGCAFRVVVASPSGDVLSWSPPQLATVPAFLNSESPEVLAWYDKYGPYLFTWPLDVQAEFARRYEGCALRQPREGEVDEAYIRAQTPVFAEALGVEGGALAVYPMLCSESSSADGRARYQIYCFAGEGITDSLPETCLLATMLAADGTIESMQILSTSAL